MTRHTPLLLPAGDRVHALKHCRPLPCSMLFSNLVYKTKITEDMKQKKQKITFLSWLGLQASELRDAGKFSTARNYRRALSSFAAFSASYYGPGGEYRDYPAGMPDWPDESTIRKYSTWLQRRGVVRNTVSFYMRILRSAYNKAADSGIVIQQHPFSHVYTGVDKTRKRAVDEDIIVRLQSLDLAGKPSLALARDMFIFSYCTRGMAFVDMAFLKKHDIYGDTISYSRKKTGQRMYVHIEKCVRTILDRYCGSDSEFIFPVIRSSEPEAAFREYQSSLGYYNRNLKVLSSLSGSDVRLSSYIARHSWASNARKYNIPLSIISAGMGHDSEKTTMIYLASLDNSEIDNANRKIVSRIENLGSAGETAH